MAYEQCIYTTRRYMYYCGCFSTTTTCKAARRPNKKAISLLKGKSVLFCSQQKIQPRPAFGSAMTHIEARPEARKYFWRVTLIPPIFFAGGFQTNRIDYKICLSVSAKLKQISSASQFKKSSLLRDRELQAAKEVNKAAWYVNIGHVTHVRPLVFRALPISRGTKNSDLRKMHKREQAGPEL